MNASEVEDLTISSLEDHGNCDAISEHGCTWRAIAIAEVNCSPHLPRIRLVCGGAVAYIAKAHAEAALCARCCQPARACWTVVPLP